MRISLAVILTGAVLVLSGCVYLRLLAFKRQLADFDRNFTLQTDDGLRLACHTPVVLAADFRWLGITPESLKSIGQSEQWHIRWKKELPPGATEKDAHDLEMELIFTDGKFARLSLPERYFALVPKPFFVGLLRGLGKAGVSQSKRLAEVSFTQAERDAITARVVATSLAMLLGTPTEKTEETKHTTLRYRYTPIPPESKNGVIDMTFVFDTASGQLERLSGRSPVGQIGFNFQTPAPASSTPR